MTATYSKGLEGVIADESSICLVDGKNGKLFYRGHSIDDIAESKSFDETCYLLLFGEFPSAVELVDYRATMAANYELPEHAAKAIEVECHGLGGFERVDGVDEHRVVRGTCRLEGEIDAYCLRGRAARTARGGPDDGRDSATI